VVPLRDRGADFDRGRENVVRARSELAAKTSSGLDPNWQFTAPLKVGDELEVDLGGAFFQGKAQVVGSTYKVVFFDGDRENGLERDQIKLLNPC